MFTTFLYALRGHGLPVGTSEWLVFLRAMRSGLATDLNGMYRLARSLLCRTEADFDKFDLAFAEVFEGLELPPDLLAKLQDWLATAAEMQEGASAAEERSLQELWDAFMETLREQEERHDGGNRWIGTAGTSPFGHSGRAAKGIRVGGPGGGRSAVSVASERRWQEYRTDRTLAVRDMHVALKSLRKLLREGRWELDLDATIRRTCDNAGDIEIVESRARENQVHLVLLMDAGGSMTPHYEQVSRLFTAAEGIKTFKSFTSYTFHNCVYGWLFEDIEEGKRIPTCDVLARLGPRHRLVFVGDASMAPYELFSPYGWPMDEAVPGLEWLQRFRRRCPASVWLNPDPPRWWNHPTVRAIGGVFPMFELSVDGLSTAVNRLRAPV
ncbi:MAG: hypothetical protein ACI8PZ_000650 [Myxococcota bacterium]|jgi:uncharacterized protein with von Willebrand factor type A (vWA) domain